MCGSQTSRGKLAPVALYVGNNMTKIKRLLIGGSGNGNVVEICCDIDCLDVPFNDQKKLVQTSYKGHVQNVQCEVKGTERYKQRTITVFNTEVIVYVYGPLVEIMDTFGK